MHWLEVVCVSTLTSSSYFRPKVIKPFGPMHDGGMRANNPTEPTLWELTCIWPDHPHPHLVLSVGTGYRETSADDTKSDRGIVHDGFIARGVRAFLSSPCLDGERAWLNILNRLDDSDRSRYFRLRYRFQSEPAALDDAPRIPSLGQMVSEFPLDLGKELKALWASRFFFELLAEPEYSRGQYLCRAMILCRFADARPLILAMRQVSFSPRLLMGNLVITDFGNKDHCCAKCGYFQREIGFEVRQLDSVVTMSLAFDRGERSPLASFPKPVNWFVEQQSKSGRWRRWRNTSICCGEMHKRRPPSSTRGRVKRRRTT